ncbi:hypothetical protein ABPG77_011462 [Micractinium sp. CCAP 211/92]
MGGAEQPAELPLVAARSAAECGIPGLATFADFVCEEEEAALLAEAEAQPHWQVLARRRVLHFGHVFDYETRGVGAPLHPIPPRARRIADRIQQLPDAVAIDQLTVNDYACGVGISPHVETHSAFTGAIVSLSLGGPAAMVLRRGGQQPRAVFLPQRTLLVMAGEARYAWQHYIPHRKSDLVVPACGEGPPEVVPRAARRVSFTFRQVRGVPCDCAYPEHCDSQLAPLAPTRMALKRMAAEQAVQLQPQAPQATPAASALQAGDGQPTAGQNGTVPAGQGSSSAVHHPQDEQQQQQQQCERQRTAGTAAGQPPGAPAAAPNPGTGPGSSAGLAGASLDASLAALEARHVHAVYDAIAPHFASTRFAVWPRVRDFLESLPPWPLLADVGCGNGKYWGVRRDAYVLGSDRSQGLARVAARRLAPRPLGEALRADAAVADGMALPYRPGSCDGVLCIAVLHHIASPTRRLALLAQLLRLLRPGGRALVTVWATQQENMRKVRSWQPLELAQKGAAETSDAGASGSCDSHLEGSAASAARAEPAARGGGQAQAPAVSSGDYFVPWHLPFHRAEAAVAARQAGGGAGSRQQQQRVEQELDGAAAAVPAAPARAAPQVDPSKGAVVYQRYYHLFEQGELDALIGQLPGAALVDSFYDKDNWCAIFERRS